MADKKQNNADSWKQMLDCPENLPGEGMPDKNAAWEKLYNRLYTKPAPRTAWYWIAATMLTMAAVSWLITSRKKNDITKASATAVHDTNSLQPSQAADFNKQPIIKTVFIKQPITHNKGAMHKKTYYGNAHPFYPPQAVATSISIVVNKPPVSIAAPVTGDSAKLVLVFTPKKKLRVLHINELGTVSPYDPEQAALAAQEKNNIKIRFKNNASGNPSAPVRQEDTGIRIPLTN